VTEIFEGDSVTSAFQLGETPLMEKATLLFDTFSATLFDTQKWAAVDGGGHISLTSRGLTLGGGTGTGGASSVAAVTLWNWERAADRARRPGGGQSGRRLLRRLGFRNGESCESGAGFHVRPNGTSTVCGTHCVGRGGGCHYDSADRPTYTLRLRFHCKTGSGAPELQRRQRVWSRAAGRPMLTAGADLVMEVQETTGGAQFPVVVLYDVR